MKECYLIEKEVREMVVFVLILVRKGRMMDLIEGLGLGFILPLYQVVRERERKKESGAGAKEAALSLQ